MSCSIFSEDFCGYRYWATIKFRCRSNLKSSVIECTRWLTREHITSTRIGTNSTNGWGGIHETPAAARTTGIQVRNRTKAHMFVSTAKSLRSLDSGGVPFAWFSEPSRRCGFDSEFHDGRALGALRPNFRDFWAVARRGKWNRGIGVTLSGT